MPFRSDYEYDDDEPGMQAAVERAREAYEPEGARESPEMDFSTPAEPDESDPLEEHLAHGRAGGGPKVAQDMTPPPEPEPRAPEQARQDDEYAAALRKVKEALSKPTQDGSKGYGEALERDRSENRINRIMDFMSQGLRRAPTAQMSDPATGAADFLRGQNLKQSGENAELGRLGKLAQLMKPPKAGASKDAGNVESLRAYLVKVGAGTPDELAGMNLQELRAAMSGFGLTKQLERFDEQSKSSAERFEETKRHNRETEATGRAAAARADDKTAKADTQDIPPEYEKTPGANPGPDSRKKFTALVASQKKLKNLTTRMRDAMKGVGRAGRVANYDALNQLATSIALESKNVADLGALSGPDLGLMNAMAQNPTSAWNIFRDSDVAKNMDGLDAWADDSVKAGEETYGLRLKGGGGGGGNLTPGGKPFSRKQVSPSTGRVRWLDAAGSVIEESPGG